MPEQSVAVAAPQAVSPPDYSPEFLQGLIDESCCFNIFVSPSGSQGDTCRCPAGSIVGFRGVSDIRRFAMGLAISANTGVRASNSTGEVTGKLSLGWLLMPHDYHAFPGCRPPQTDFDRTVSQRFVMTEMNFTFGDGPDGFRSFGTGRTFPVESAGQPRLTVAAVGNITEGFGRFRGHEGTYTLCGELEPEQGFIGHITIRVADPQNTLRDAKVLPVINPVADPDPSAAYLFWTAQKGRGASQANSASLDPQGRMRGLNIPTQLKECSLDFTVRNDGFQAAAYKAGAIIGREIGFGRGSDPVAPPAGTPPRCAYLFRRCGPVQLLHSPDRDTLLFRFPHPTNVIEGRRFDLLLPRAPGEVAWRFGFFRADRAGHGLFSGSGRNLLRSVQFRLQATAGRSRHHTSICGASDRSR